MAKYSSFNNIEDVIVYAKNITEIPIGNTEDLELSQLLEIVYEWEYKYDQIKRSEKLPEKRKINTLNQIERKVTPIIQSIATKLYYVFTEWLSHHAINDPQQWAADRAEQSLEGSDYHSAWMSAEFEYENYGGGNITYDFIRCNASYFSEALLEDIEFQIDNLDPSDEDYEQQKSDLESMKYSDPSDIANYFEDMGFDIKTSVFQNDYYSAWYDDMLVNFYRDCVFPLWYDKWGSEGIDDTRDRIMEIQSTLPEITSGAFEQQFMNLNIALQASHQTGGMIDYINQEYDDVDKEYLDYLSNQDTEEWDTELRMMGV